MKKTIINTKTLLFGILAFCIAISIVSCSKDKDKNEKLSKETDVYVAGVTKTGSKSIAALWKNGQLQKLTDGTKWAFTYSVFVSGGDVFVAGFEENSSGKAVAKIWKNGNLWKDITLGTTDAVAISLYVSSDKVYVAGYQDAPPNTVYAKVWILNRNTGAIETNKTLSKTNNKAYGNSIYVSGDDYFVTGYEAALGGKAIAKVWKNGTLLKNLTTGSTDAEGKSIYVSGADYYVAGYEGNSSGYRVAKVWKNGTIYQTLTDGSDDAYAYSVAVANNVVYVGGYDLATNPNITRLWKDGIVQNLEGAEDYISIYSIYVHNNNVYAAGLKNSEGGGNLRV